jgi:putative addiction module component (TIGR02574 family)
MASLMEALGIDKLSVDERLQLLDEIWESLDAERERPPLTETQQSDLERRLIDYEADPGAGSPWAEVKARLLDQR